MKTLIRLPFSWPLSIYLKRGWRGFHRLHSIVGSPLIEYQTKHGLVFALDPTDYVDSRVIKYGFYEEEVLKAILKVSSDLSNPIVWDIGANIGLHGLTVAKCLPKSFVYLFEPNPLLAPRIEGSINKNYIFNTCLVQCALSDKAGDQTLFTYQGNSGNSSLHNWHSSKSLLNVSAKRGDVLIRSNQLRCPNIIKIDVEGHELQALSGLGDFICSPPLRVIIFENSRENNTDVKCLLRSNGFYISEPLTRLENTRYNLENYVATRY